MFDGNVAIFERELRKMVDARRQELASQLVSATAVTDFPQYLHLVGFVKAFDEVVEMLAVVRDRINQREQ